MSILFNQLTELDKKRIDNYLSKWGVMGEHIPPEDYLSFWDKNKRKMFKLLGNKFIYSCPFQYEKPKVEIKRELTNLNLGECSEEENSFYLFLKEFRSFLGYGKSPRSGRLISDSTFTTILNNIISPNMYDIFAENSFRGTVKERAADKTKELRLQSGGKIAKAIQKILNYYKEDIIKWQELCQIEEDPENCIGKAFTENNDLFELFEKFRLIYSMVFNDKLIKGTLNISIHPLDFMTMSDNNSKWTSCMSWKGEGCYRQGTVEMMNSNCVLCCYITRNKNNFFDFRDHSNTLREIKTEPSEDWVWNNKHWRQLVYFNKDIIVGGKAYPYLNDEISKTVVNEIRKLAKENLNWDYKYGPELYKDMLHIKSMYGINRARGYRMNNPRKKNIIFHTNAMYNDFIADYPEFNYWCCRNKVKKTTIINISGPTKCLCCGSTQHMRMDNFDMDYDGDGVELYHDRFFNVDSLICFDCKEEKFTCDICDDQSSILKFYTIDYYDGTEKKVCKNCMAEIKVCPDCGRGFIPDRNDIVYLNYKGAVPSLEKMYFQLYRKRWEDPWLKDCEDACFSLVCPRCEAKSDHFAKYKALSSIIPLEEYNAKVREKDMYYFENYYRGFRLRVRENVDLDSEEESKYFYKNLKKYLTC
jgi:hypothetical protein